MSDTPRLVTGVFRSPSGQVYPNKTIVIYRRNRKVVAQGSSVVVDEVERTTINAQGEIEVSLLPGAYLGRIALEDADRYFEFGVPEGSGAYSIEDAVENASPFIEPASVAEAQAARDKAQEWAESATAPGAAGTKSSKTWAAESAASAAAALSEANRADTEADRSQAEADRAEGFANGVDPAYGRVTYFVANSGSDLANGITPATAFQTLAKAAAVANAGDIVRLARGGVWRETANFASGVIVEPYGNGLRPIISGQDVVSSFTIEGAGPSYTFTIDLPAGSAARAYPGVWEDGRRLTEVKVGDPGIGNAAAAIAAVAATPGTFYFAGPGTYSAGWSAGTKTYHVHASDGGNPNTNGKVYEAYKREFATGASALYRDIRIQCGFHHDGSSQAMEGGTIERLARHGNLPAIPQYKDVLVIGDNPAYGGGGYFHSNPGSLQPDATYERCVVVGENRNGIGFYQHGQVAGQHRRLVTRLRDCAAYNVGLCIGFDEVELVEVDGLRARNFDGLVSASSNGRVIMRGVDAKGGSGGTGSGGRLLDSTSPGALTIRDSRIEYRSVGMFFTSGSFGPVEVYDTDLIHVTEPVAGSTNVIAWANNTALARFWLERCRIIAPSEAGTSLILATSAPDVRIRDCLFVGASTNSIISGVTTPLLTLDPDARAISISREKAITKYDEDGVELKHGVYQPGDWIFSGIAHPGSARQPRRYIAVGDRIIGTGLGVSRMTDWAVIATPSSHLNSVCFNEGGSGTRFIAVGNNGLIMRSDANGENWTVVGAGVTTQHLRAVWAMDAAGTVVAVGDNGTVLRSTDGGATWAAAATPGTTRSLFGVASNRAGTLWVACGAEGRVITSTDGNTWTEQTQGTATWRVAYRVNDATFLIGGDGGGLRTSPDGATWTTRTTNTINSIRGFGWNGGGNVVAIARQTSNFTDTFLNSADSGATWTIDEQTVPMELNAITGGLNPMESFGVGNDFIFGNQYFVAVGESQAACLRMLKAWNCRRILTNDTVDRAETFEKWLGRAQ